MELKKDPTLICVRQHPEVFAKLFADNIFPHIAKALLEHHNNDFHLEIRFSIVRDETNKWADYAKWNIYERQEKRLWGAD